jgi:hypothetical protein
MIEYAENLANGYPLFKCKYWLNIQKGGLLIYMHGGLYINKTDGE